MQYGLQVNTLVTPFYRSEEHLAQMLDFEAQFPQLLDPYLLFNLPLPRLLSR
jgi:hypothetical protein